MRQLSGLTITGRADSATEEGALADYVLENCFFDNCVVGGGPNRPASRPRVRNVVARGCRQRGSALFGALLQDVTVDGLGRDGRHPLFLWAPAFKHVVLRGLLSAPKLNVVVSPDGRGSAEWTSANQEFYKTVDWALDIREAEFQARRATPW